MSMTSQEINKYLHKNFFIKVLYLEQPTVTIQILPQMCIQNRKFQ